MSPEFSEDVRALREAVGELKVTNATLTSAVQMLTEAMAAAATIYVRKDVIEPRIDAVEKRQAKQDSNWEWLIKLVGAFVVVGVLTAWLTAGGPLP